MKIINTLIACSLLATSALVLAVDNDPEMDAVDTAADRREQPPPGIDTATLLEVTATVTAIDMENRLVTIEGPEGDSAVIQVGEQVKNLPQAEVGDRVRIKYYRSAYVDIARTDARLGTEIGAAKASAPAGEKPAGAIGVEMTRRAEVVFVDPYQKFISFRSPDRGLRKISLKESPDLQHYLHELKKGDIVEVTYTEALAVSLEPAK
ncbi:MAG: hypothetical protein WBP44_12600 [Gammaproteobacteria bacterium]|jgi:hypothetical protein